ncbi:MAG TPA: 2-dehydropantoate 2-reductase [Gemmatimonadaceae bacterium]|nr:2-dehydropantoate 2-reductase [Gemmatimonadaceae bacterium]
MSTPRIAVLGAGGVGSYYGALLARSGVDVTLIARGEHLDAIRSRGLVVRTPEGEWTSQVPATSDPAAVARDFGRDDFAILSVKAYALDSVLPAVHEFAGRGATVLPLLNGVDTTERLVNGGVDAARVLGGITYISAARVSPGAVERSGDFQRVIAGEMDAPASPRVDTIVGLFRDAGVDATAANDIRLELWRKFVFLSAIAGVCGAARLSIGPIRDTANGLEMLIRAVREGAAVARAEGVAYSADDEAAAIQRITALPGGMKPSLLLDVEEGRQTEIESLSGTVCALGRRLGVATPVHEAAMAHVSGGTVLPVG